MRTGKIIIFIRSTSLFLGSFYLRVYIFKAFIYVLRAFTPLTQTQASNEEQKCANSAKTLPGYLFNTAKVVKDLNSKTAVPTAAIKPVNNQLAYEADTVIFKKNVSRVAHNKKTAGSITVSTVRGGSETNTERRLKRIDRSTMANKGIYSAETLGLYKFLHELSSQM